ncbi:MAG: helix-turn-helix domain-containing protein [Turicibacter sp.]
MKFLYTISGGDGMTFGEKLKQLRVKNEYSQENLAQLLNVSRQAVTKWENGNGIPDIENLKAIATLFDVTIDSLVRDEEEIETTEEGFCWNLACGGGIIGLVLGFLFQDVYEMAIGTFGIGGGVIGYVLGYIILLVRQKK